MLEETIYNSPFGEKTITVLIDGKNYEIKLQWERKITITLKPAGQIIQTTAVSEIKKSQLISLITRNTQYSLRGKKTPLIDKLLSNKYTPALLQYPASKIFCEKERIHYTATIRKKDIAQVEKIRSYFEALVLTSK